MEEIVTSRRGETDPLDIVTNRWGGKGIETQIRELFDEDGTVYLITGYFSHNAYRRLEPDITTFLNRSPENELVVVVSPTADQFAPAIVRDLRRADPGEQVHLYTYPDGCLHAKLYVRTGDDPVVLLGSANLTRVAFEQNLELSVRFDDDTLSESQFEEFVELAEQLRSECRPIRRRDVLWPVMAANSVSVWFNKARLLPRDALFHQPLLLLVLLTVFLYIAFGGTIF